MCHWCAEAHTCRGERANTHGALPVAPPHAPRPWYLYWQEVPLPSWQRCLCRPARRARQSASASASPSSALSSRAVGRALPPAGEQHVSPRCAHHPPWHPHKAPFSVLASSLTSLQAGRAAVLAAPNAGVVTGWGGPAPLTVAVPMVVAHLGG